MLISKRLLLLTKIDYRSNPLQADASASLGKITLRFFVVRKPLLLLSLESPPFAHSRSFYLSIKKSDYAKRALYFRNSQEKRKAPGARHRNVDFYTFLTHEKGCPKRFYLWDTLEAIRTSILPIKLTAVYLSACFFNINGLPASILYPFYANLILLAIVTTYSSNSTLGIATIT